MSCRVWEHRQAERGGAWGSSVEVLSATWGIQKHMVSQLQDVFLLQVGQKSSVE